MKRLLTALAVLALVASAAAQTLVVGQSGLPVTLDTGQDGNSLTPAIQVVERLVGFEQGSAQIEPLLATSWEPNEDSTVWTFTLREGVSFHDGTPFNAEAVKFNFDRWNLRDHEFNFVDQGRDFTSFTYVFGGYHGDPGYQIESVEVIDDHTVQFNLTGSIGFFPQQLASAYFGLHSPAAVAAGGIEYGTPTVGIVGTGPFVFGEWIDGDRVVLTRNNDYWGQVAGVEQIVFRGIESPTARLAELEAGSIDIALNLSPESYDIVAGSDQFRPVSAESDLVIGYLGMHQANKPFDDLRVRQAVAHAVNKEALVKGVLSGIGTLGGSYESSVIEGSATDIPPYPYDPDKARALLAEAGHPNGFSVDFYVPTGRYTNDRQLGEAIQAQLAEVGIKANLHSPEISSYLNLLTQARAPLFISGKGSPSGDMDFTQTLSHGSTGRMNHFNLKNAEVDRLIDEQRVAVDPEARREILHRLQQKVYDTLPHVTLYYEDQLWATRANVHDVRVYVNEFVDFSRAWKE